MFSQLLKETDDIFKPVSPEDAQKRRVVLLAQHKAEGYTGTGYTFYRGVKSEQEYYQYVRTHDSGPDDCEAFKYMLPGDDELASREGGTIISEEFDEDVWNEIPDTLAEALGLNEAEDIFKPAREEDRSARQKVRIDSLLADAKDTMVEDAKVVAMDAGDKIVYHIYDWNDDRTNEFLFSVEEALSMLKQMLEDGFDALRIERMIDDGNDTYGEDIIWSMSGD